MALSVLRQCNRQQELMDFSLKDVFEKLQMDHLQFQDWLRLMGLMSTPLCPSCQVFMTNDEHHNGWVCNRRSCRTGSTNETKVYVPAKIGSFFDKSNLGESTAFALSYFWLHDIGKVKDKAYELHMNPRTVVQWRNVSVTSAQNTSEGTHQSSEDSDVKWKSTKPWLLGANTTEDAGCVDTNGFSEASRGEAVELSSPLFGGGMPPLPCVS
ncbi:hypothetical protein V3C99_017902 [Haemonchus contortus]|uniref:Ski_Sno domain-containing protein n=1 Tax=Haemonchus contortus TaxID=6289 RepID=A0A7I4Z3W2_HAECO